MKDAKEGVDIVVDGVLCLGMASVAAFERQGRKRLEEEARYFNSLERELASLIAVEEVVSEVLVCTYVN